MKRLATTILLLIIVSLANAKPCLLVSGDCPQRARPSAAEQQGQEQAFKAKMGKWVASGTGLNANGDLYGQLLSQIATHSPAEAIAQLGLASSNAARFCFWAGSHAKQINDYDFIPNSSLLRSRDNAVFHHGVGVCDCYQLTSDIVQKSHRYSMMFIKALISLSSDNAPLPQKATTVRPPDITQSVQQSIKAKKQTLATFTALKNEQPGDKCQQLLQTYMTTLATCPKASTNNGHFIPCPSYQEDYGQ